MDTSLFLITNNKLPNGFEYPEPFLKIIENGLVNFNPWYILSKETLEWRYNGLKQRYPNSKFIPFAARYDNDDVACWENTNTEKVIIIHDFATEGWERRISYNNFWDWFRVAIEEMIVFD